MPVLPDLAKDATCFPFHSNDSATEGLHRVRDPAPVRCKNIKLNLFPSSSISDVDKPTCDANT